MTKNINPTESILKAQTTLLCLPIPHLRPINIPQQPLPLILPPPPHLPKIQNHANNKAKHTNRREYNSQQKEQT